MLLRKIHDPHFWCSPCKFHANSYEFFLLNFGSNRNTRGAPCCTTGMEDDDFTVRYHLNISYSKNKVVENGVVKSVAASWTMLPIYYGPMSLICRA